MGWVGCPKCGVLYRGEHSCKEGEIITTKEFRGLVSAMSQAIETSAFRISEHLRTGVPLDLELVKREFENIERVARSTLADLKKVI